MGEYRQDFIVKHPGKTRNGYPGYWYKCANCGKWCGRPGNTGATIPDDAKMEVDHIRPWSMGGSDKVWNLQPLCKPCNRSKSNNITFRDRLKIFKNTILHPFDSIVKSGLRKAVRQNKILKKIGIGRRN